MLIYVTNAKGKYLFYLKQVFQLILLCEVVDPICTVLAKVKENLVPPKAAYFGVYWPTSPVR